jgi:hypothetical protein
LKNTRKTQFNKVFRLGFKLTKIWLKGLFSELEGGSNYTSIPSSREGLLMPRKMAASTPQSFLLLNTILIDFTRKTVLV